MCNDIYIAESQDTFVVHITVNFADQCIEINNGLSLPSFHDYRSDDRITLYHQAIVPSYRLTCCGEIRAWGVDVEFGGRMDDEEYTHDFCVSAYCCCSVKEKEESGLYQSTSG